MAPQSSPTLLKNSAGLQSCCIFRIPHTLVKANDKAYNPNIVSIGPYHHCDGSKGTEHLMMIQEHKQRYLDIFLSKTAQKDVSLAHLRGVVLEMESRIRDSYSEDLIFDREHLIDMMLLDGCFILMVLLLSSRKLRHNYKEDPILVMRWILPTLRSDLLLLENQVPLFLLQDLFKASKLFPSTSLNTMIFKFFGYSIKRPQTFWDERENLKASHLLDLIRKTFKPNPSQERREQSCIDICCGSTCFNIFSHPNITVEAETPNPTHPPTPPPPPPRSLPPSPHLGLIVSAKKLRLRGIKFKPKEKFDTPLEISLKNGVLEIPKLTFDDCFSSLLINCVAFEQFNMKCSTEMTSYVTFMGCLINTEEDATFLSEKGIIENYFGTGEEISLFFKNIGKDISFNISKSYLSKEFEGVNKYSSQGLHVHRAGLQYKYFNSPWTILSTIAAVVLVLLTIFQSFFAAYAYFRPPN